jgi:dTMP kinase
MNRTDTTTPGTGTLIAVEGIDGAGKTTQVNCLVDFFTAVREPFIRSREPTDGQWGRLIRGSAASHRLSPAEELNALIEDRREHVRNLIRPALDRGHTVILDRYFYSTIAYQGVAGGDAEDIARRMHEEFPIPDAVFLIDVPAEVGRARIETGRGEQPNSFEDANNLRAVRDAFIRMAGRNQEVQVIDGTQPIDLVRRAVMRSLIEGVLKRRHCAKAYGCDDPHLCSYRITKTCRWVEMCQHAGLAPTF